MARAYYSILFVCLITHHAHAGDMPEPTEKVKKHLGQDVVTLILAANKVEAFRVGNVDHEKAGTKETLGGRLLDNGAAGKELSKEFLDRLKSALVAEDTYFKADSKGTKTGVAFRLTSADGGVFEVSYCVVKGNVWIVAKDKDGRVIKKGDMRGFRDDKNSPMRALAAEAFPDDVDVLKYKPK